MKQQSSLPKLISLFQSVEDHLHNQKLGTCPYQQPNPFSHCDPKNFYAIAIERRMKHVLDFQQRPSAANSNSMEYSVARMIAALEHVCQMAVRHFTNLSEQASIHDMSHQLREQALENKHQSLLHRARQHFHVHEYEQALNEAERARIIRPSSAEADTLIREIKKHITISTIIEKQPSSSQVTSKEIIIKPTQQPQDLKLNSAIEKPEAITEKILSSISFADYYRTNADYAVCIRYIEQGLELDPSNRSASSNERGS